MSKIAHLRQGWKKSYWFRTKILQPSHSSWSSRGQKIHQVGTFSSYISSSLAMPALPDVLNWMPYRHAGNCGISCCVGNTWRMESKANNIFFTMMHAQSLECAIFFSDFAYKFPGAYFMLLPYFLPKHLGKLKCKRNIATQPLVTSLKITLYPWWHVHPGFVCILFLKKYSPWSINSLSRVKTVSSGNLGFSSSELIYSQGSLYWPCTWSQAV